MVCGPLAVAAAFAEVDHAKDGTSEFGLHRRDTAKDGRGSGLRQVGERLPFGAESWLGGQKGDDHRCECCDGHASKHPPTPDCPCEVVGGWLRGRGTVWRLGKLFEALLDECRKIGLLTDFFGILELLVVEGLCVWCMGEASEEFVSFFIGQCTDVQLV